MTTKKTTSSRKKTSKPKRSQSSLLKKAWSIFWKLGVITMVLLTCYTIYLDQIIARKFEGQKWHLPAQIYGRSMALYPGAAISHQQLINELKLLGYRKVTHPRQVGEFSASSTKVDIWRRSFHHPEGNQHQQRVMVTFNQQGVQSVLRPDQRQLAIFYLEPILLDRIITSDGQDRLFVPADKIPPLIVKALLQTEDREFYHHHGINPLAILRALFINISAGRTVQGGSTLTQQLAKNFFLTPERSLIRKAREALMALVIDYRYSKDEILEAYLNEVYMGQDRARSVHGLGLASQFYFGRPISELSIDQQAFLVAVIKGPSYYNPWRNPERAMERRDLVLRLLMDSGDLSTSQYRLSVNAPLGIRKSSREVHQKLPAFFDLVKQELAERYGPELLKMSGIKIYTTLDPLAQRAAEKAVTSTMKRLRKQAGNQDLQVGMVVTDKLNAGVAAMVGDRRPTYHGYNRAMTIRRPIGSLIKPFVYATALAKPTTYNLASPLDDKPITLTNGKGKTWSPQNVDKQFLNNVSLLTAFKRSRNVPTVNLGMALGVANVMDTLVDAGWSETISPYPSMLLGALNGSPMMVAQVYQTIADSGRMRPLSAITYVLDNNDNLIDTHHASAKQAISPQADYLTQYAMTKVVQSGTATRLHKQFPNTRLAGKTGTSNDNRDSWFAGFDERNVAVVWVGKDDNSKTGLYGSSGALTVYQQFLNYRKPIALRLAPPSGIVQGYFDTQTGLPMEADCENVIQLPSDSKSYQPAANCGKPLSWWQKIL
ncbi:penicillin-binding protein 1B [Parashewanella curva]|uniref:Penicillin-binding protein 1B n=1 Tax=Parashewanella curva TaxID=2338552 RepID=A0A3L8PV82_9GAMM|nr:penicillin-binding protein 1B [Parashewanella curva]RLV59224.1 penicillin-binding protein 1B [Parashewanella curva]